MLTTTIKKNKLLLNIISLTIILVSHLLTTSLIEVGPTNLYMGLTFIREVVSNMVNKYSTNSITLSLIFTTNK